MKFLISLLLILTCLCIAAALSGCTQPGVNGVINGTNEVIDQVLSPVADRPGTTGIEPYIRLGATFIRGLAYQFVDLVRIFSPNAGEPTTQPVAFKVKQYVPEYSRTDLAMARTGQ